MVARITRARYMTQMTVFAVAYASDRAGLFVVNCLTIVALRWSAGQDSSPVCPWSFPSRSLLPSWGGSGGMGTQFQAGSAPVRTAATPATTSSATFPARAYLIGLCFAMLAPFLDYCRAPMTPASVSFPGAAIRFALRCRPGL